MIEQGRIQDMVVPAPFTDGYDGGNADGIDAVTCEDDDGDIAMARLLRPSWLSERISSKYPSKTLYDCC